MRGATGGYLQTCSLTGSLSPMFSVIQVSCLATWDRHARTNSTGSAKYLTSEIFRREDVNLQTRWGAPVVSRDQTFSMDRTVNVE
jgi:hypothetical protein